MGRHVLPVTQVTRFVVSDRECGSGFAIRRGLRGKTDFDEPLMNIANFRRPDSRALAVQQVVAQEPVVVLKVRAASGSVGDDGVERIEIERVNISPRHDFRGIKVSIMGVQRATARLVAWRHDSASGCKEDCRGVAINVGEANILHATGEQSDTIPRRLGGGLFKESNSLVGMEKISAGRLGFEPADVVGQKPQKVQLPRQPLQPGHAIKPEHAPDQLEKPGPHENNFENEVTDTVALWGAENAGCLRVSPRHFEQVRVINTRWAGRLAGKASEAEIHLIRKCPRCLQLVVRDGTHECDASARAVLFMTCCIVSRAGGKAKSAMHALLKNRIVERFEKAMSRFGGDILRFRTGR